MTVGEKIYELRKKKNVKQKDIAIYLELPKKVIDSWENDDKLLDEEYVEKLASYFEIDKSYFSNDNLEAIKANNKVIKRSVNLFSISSLLMIFSIIFGVFSFLYYGVKDYYGTYFTVVNLVFNTFVLMILSYINFFISIFLFCYIIWSISSNYTFTIMHRKYKKYKNTFIIIFCVLVLLRLGVWIGCECFYLYEEMYNLFRYSNL